MSTSTSARLWTEKLRKCGLGEWTVSWIENWLKDNAQSCHQWRSLLGGV